jgi:tol-pal system protein YbgF
MRYLLTPVLAAVLMLPMTLPAQSDGDAPVVRSGSGAGGGSSTELFFMLEELRQEIQQLRGQVEETSHELDRLNRQSRQRYVDLDQRLVDLSSRVAELEDASGNANSGESNSDSNADSGNSSGKQGSVSYRQPGEEERKDYASIQNLIQNEKDFDAAIDEIYQFLDQYPEGDLTVNAYYWLGELYLSQESYEQARQAFTIVTSRHQSHRKAADAQFKLAVTHDRADNPEKARNALERLQSEYPETESAAKGRQYRSEEMD